MRLQGMDQNSFFVDAINCEAIKVKPMSTIKTAFLVMVLHQKLPRRSFKSYVNNISLCQADFLKLKFPWLKKLSFSDREAIKMQTNSRYQNCLSNNGISPKTT